ncbi:MAG: GNAT family N-acetyltransferase [Dehalococcoidia bacterium]
MTSPFEGRLIRLRVREPEDVPLLYTWFNDPEVTQWLTLRYPLSMQQQRDYVAAVSAPGFAHASLAVVTKAEGTLIGGVDFHDVHVENRGGPCRRSRCPRLPASDPA